MATAIELKLLTLIHNPWRLNAYQTTTQSISNNANTTIKFDTAESDPDGDLNTGTGVYTCPVDGWYQVEGTVCLTTTASATSAFFTMVLQNSSRIRRGTTMSWTAAAPTANPTSTTHGLIRCAAGDTLAIQAIQTTGGAVSTIVADRSCTWMDIYWVGPT